MKTKSADAYRRALVAAAKELGEPAPITAKQALSALCVLLTSVLFVTVLLWFLTLPR